MIPPRYCTLSLVLLEAKELVILQSTQYTGIPPTNTISGTIAFFTHSNGNKSLMSHSYFVVTDPMEIANGIASQ